MGIFLVANDDVAGADTLQCEVAMGVELHPDHALFANDGTRALQDIALHVVVAVGDHGTVKSEEHAVHGHCGAELVEDLIAHELIIGPVGGTRWTGSKAASLDERKALLGGTAPGN